MDSDLEDLYEYESQSAPSQSSATASDVEEPIDSDLEDLYESFEHESQSPPSQSSATASDTAKGDSVSGIPSLDGHGSSLSKPIYPGALLTVLQSYLLVFQYATRHGLTTKAFMELLHLLTVHVPLGCSIPKSVHRLKCFFVQAFPHAKTTEHFYCSCCQRPLASVTATCSGEGCSNESPAVFVTIPLGPQIQRLMEGMYISIACNINFKLQQKSCIVAMLRLRFNCLETASLSV